MSVSLYSQWMTILFMFISGITLGIAYDGSRVVAGQLRFPRWTLPVIDIMYWVVATWFVFHMLVKGNQGELRFYVILGLAIGAWSYVVLLSRITVVVTTWILKAVKAIIRFAMRVIHFCVLIPLKGIGLFIYYIFRILVRTTMFLGKVMLKCIQPIWWLLRWLFRPLVMPLWHRFGMNERLIRLKQYGGKCVLAIARIWRRVRTGCARGWTQLLKWLNLNNQA